MVAQVGWLLRWDGSCNVIGCASVGEHVDGVRLGWGLGRREGLRWQQMLGLARWNMEYGIGNRLAVRRISEFCSRVLLGLCCKIGIYFSMCAGCCPALCYTDCVRSERVPNAFSEFRPRIAVSMEKLDFVNQRRHAKPTNLSSTGACALTDPEWGFCAACNSASILNTMKPAAFTAGADIVTAAALNCSKTCQRDHHAPALLPPASMSKHICTFE